MKRTIGINETGYVFYGHPDLFLCYASITNNKRPLGGVCFLKKNCNIGQRPSGGSDNQTAEAENFAHLA